MKSHRSLYSLLVLLVVYLAVGTSAQDETSVPTPSVPESKSETPVIEQAIPPQDPPLGSEPQKERDSISHASGNAGENKNSRDDMPLDNGNVEEPIDPLTDNSTDSMCKKSEILTATKGCVDREDYLQNAMLNTWMSKSLDELKEGAGLDNSVDCKSDEILTSFGCAPKPQPLRGEQRSPVLGSHLHGDTVYNSQDTIPAPAVSKEAVLLGEGFDPANRVFSEVHTQDDYPKTNHNRYLKQAKSPAEHVLGHNRPREFVLLPGRRVLSDRKCRPYEVLTSNKRCIRKRGKVGFYKHKDHRYSLQRRHRHAKYENSDN